MTSVETVDPRVRRDIESKALLAVDRSELSRSRATRAIIKRTQIQQANADSRFAELDTRMKRIEELLDKLVNKGQN